MCDLPELVATLVVGTFTFSLAFLYVREELLKRSGR